MGIRGFMKDYGKATALSSDFGVGVLAGVTAFVVVLTEPNGVRTNAVAILLGAAALGVALLAVVLTAMAILGGISSDYRAILSRTKRGVRGAFMPYRTVAVVSGLLVLVAGIGLLLTDVGNDFTAALGSALIAWLAAWATWGTVQLTEITAGHAQKQARLEEEPTADEIAAFRSSRSAPRVG